MLQSNNGSNEDEHEHLLQIEAVLEITHVEKCMKREEATSCSSYLGQHGGEGDGPEQGFERRKGNSILHSCRVLIARPLSTCRELGVGGSEHASTWAHDDLDWRSPGFTAKSSSKGLGLGMLFPDGKLSSCLLEPAIPRTAMIGP